MSSATIIAPQPDLADRLHWALSRLVNHGWTVNHLGLDGSLTASTPGGALADLAAQPDTSEPTLEQQGCRLRYILAGQPDGRRSLAKVGARLRLRMPAGRPHRDDQSRPWRVPVPLQRQPAAPVRSAYWTATTLTDDYRWQLTALCPNGFDATVPGRDDTLRYRGGQCHDGTTACRLVHLLAALKPAAVDELSALLDSHRHRLPATMGAAR